jgi:alpha-tubulin suppressor-like RCC1 family protein
MAHLRQLVAPLLLVAVMVACNDSNDPSGEKPFILSEVVATGQSSCGLTPGGSLYCWGLPLTVYGLCDTNCVLRPRLVLDSTQRRLHGLAGGQAGIVCGLDPNGRIWCGGQLLTDIDIVQMMNPFDDLVGPEPMTQVSVGSGHICGIGASGAAYCWGDHDGARRGDYGSHFGTGTDFIANMVSTPGNLVSLSTTFGSTCGVVGNGASTVCWGWGPLLGNPAAPIDTAQGNCGFFAPCSRDPVPLSGGHQFSKVVSGGRHSCGLELAGGVYCWGFNDVGQLGTGDTISHAGPLSISLPAAATELSAGGSRTCAFLSSGETWCWGLLSTPDQITAPTRLTGSRHFSTVSLANGHACGLTAKGEAYCWGANESGQLGTGNTSYSGSPRAVLPPL